MKFSADTISVLKNFAIINQGIYLNPGKVLRTVHPMKTVMATADIPDEIEGEARIFDLPKFIATLSLFDDPDVTFKEDHFVIKSGRSRTVYAFAGEDVIVRPPEKDISFPSVDATIKLEWKEIDSVIRAAGVLRVTHIGFISDSDGFRIVATDPKNLSSSDFSISPEDVAVNGEFKMYIKIENLKLLSEDYEIMLSSKGLAHFKSSRVNYWIALQA